MTLFDEVWGMIGLSLLMGTAFFAGYVCAEVFRKFPPQTTSAPIRYRPPLSLKDQVWINELTESL